MGGSRHSNCSILEAMQRIESLSRLKVQYALTDQARSGDHIWWISDVSKFMSHYPLWKYAYSLDDILGQIIEAATFRSGREKA
jgi:CDP-paratose 2-epimerase